jgi:hypothetical protein
MVVDGKEFEEADAGTLAARQCSQSGSVHLHRQYCAAVNLTFEIRSRWHNSGEKSRTWFSTADDLLSQLLEQRFSLFQVRSIETFGEPVVDFGKHRARLSATACIAQQSR